LEKNTKSALYIFVIFTSSMDKQTDNIQVMVRVRPLNDREKREGAKSCIILDEEAPNSIIIDAKPETKTFKFDFVGGDKTTQEDIF